MDRLHVLVCVTGQKTCEHLILEGAKRAKEVDAALSVIHVAKPGSGVLGNPKEGEALDYLYQIASAYGAEMTVIHSEDIVGTLSQYAKKAGADHIVLGVSRHGKWDVAHLLEAALPGATVQVVYTQE